MKRARKIIAARLVLGEVKRPSDDRRQARRHDECQRKISHIAQFRSERPLPQRAQLRPLFAYSESALLRGWQGRGRGRYGPLAHADLLHLLKQTEAVVLVAPVIGRKTSSRNKLAAVVLLVDDVSAQVAQRRLKHIENKLGAGGPARRTTAKLRAEMVFMLRLCEIGQHFLRRSEESQSATLVE